MTVVALCETAGHAEAAAHALGVAAPLHGARTVLVVPRTEGEQGARIEAAVALHRSAKGAASEAIRLDVFGGARAFVPDTVARLVATDLPTFVWWVGDLPDRETALEKIAIGARATVAVVNANDMDLRDLAVLDALAAHGDQTNVALADFCWHRLRTWQDLLARFFDESSCVADLPKATRLRVGFQPRARVEEPVSNQAALFVGWLATRLGWGEARWTSKDAKNPTAVLPRAGGEVEVVFERMHRAGVLEGALIDVELTAGEGRYHLYRGDDPLVLCREGHHPREPVPAQCVRVHLPDDGAMLCRVLERPLRDPLYEASLRAARALVAEIAPKAPAARGAGA